MSHHELKRKALNRAGVKTEYEALEPEFTLLKALLSARKSDEKNSLTKILKIC